MRVWIAACLAAMAALGTEVRADIGDYLTRPVVEVRVVEAGRSVDDARIAALVATRVGEPLTMGRVRESIAHLFSLGRFEDVRVDAEARAGDSVALTYVLVPRRAIAHIVFAGAPGGVDEGDLRRLIGERFGPTPRAERAPDIARLIEDELHVDGYLRARATPRPVVADELTPTATLVVDITPGPRTLIGALAVEGDAGMTPARLFDRLGLSTGRPYEAERLTARIEQYLEDRRRDGFFLARLSMASQLVDEGRAINLAFSAVRGPLVRVIFAGDPLPADQRDELVPIGREGSVDEDLLEDSSNRIRDYYRAQGYRDTRAEYAREEVDGELRVTFSVTRGAQYRVARVQIDGASGLPLAEFESRLRVHPGQPLSDAALDADLALIETAYQRAGFAAARVGAAVEPDPMAAGASEVPVGIRIQIVEGPRTIVEAVSFTGNQAVSGAALSDAVGLRAGGSFVAAQMALDRDTIQLLYANLGYPGAFVSTTPTLNAENTRAQITVAIREGARVYVDHVLIVGNERTRTSTIERELQFKPGDPLGLEALNESQRRLASLGLFRRARITELGHGDDTRRDILVTLEEAPATSLSYGGGLEVGQGTGSENGVATEQLEFSPRAFVEIGRRNLWGKNRSVNLFTRVSLRSKDVPTNDAGTATTTTGFKEYRVIGTFREPRVFGTRADAFLAGTLEQQARSSFNFARESFSAEVGRRITPQFSVSGNYQLQRTETFDELVDAEFERLIDRAFPQVRLSSFSASGVRDTRDDLTDPLSGHFFSANAQIAARNIGSEVGFAKTYLTAQMFRQLMATRRMVFAASARIGLATGFPRLVPIIDDNGNPVLGPGGTPVITTSVDLPASERFFAGGDTTVRGFALDALGTPETIDKDGFPIGGGGLVILNAELRVPLRGGIGLVGFVDAGNVFARPSSIDLSQLRSAVGFGVRYKSPIGPIRMDVGFKTERKVIALGSRESASALHISLGQAF